MEKANLAIIIILILILGSFAGFLGFSNNTTQDKKKNSNNNNGIGNFSYGETFIFPLLGGGEKNMSEYYGKIVILDFMGANCGPCQKMMIVLKQLSEDYRDKIEIISIDVWIILGETSSTLQQMIDVFSQQGVDLDWTFGLDDSSGALYFKYASGGVPLIHILDKNGNIYYTKNGYLDGYSDYYELSEKIDELIE